MDSDLSSSPMSRRSLTDYVYNGEFYTILEDKEANTISRSSAKGEYRVMESTCEISWILEVCKELGVNGMNPVQIFCDNKTAIQQPYVS